MHLTARLACLAMTVVALLALPSVAGAQAPPPDTEFEKVTLNARPGEPMDLAVLPDGRVLHVTRPGVVWLHDPTNGVNSIVGEFDLYQHDEEGLQNIALDPNFERNRWVYLYYSPPLDTPLDDPDTPDVNEGDAPFEGTQADWDRFKGYLQLSRFKFQRDRIDHEQRGEDHPGAGRPRHLLPRRRRHRLRRRREPLPLDRRRHEPVLVGRVHADRRAAGSQSRLRRPAHSANTNDLRGKIIRITPKKGGGYTVPMGNLFAPGTPLTKPEIYVMGFRNPFRIELTRRSGDLFVADYSPDANEPNPLRGPAGPGQVDDRARGSQLRLAVLRHRRAAVRGLRLRHRRLRRAVQLRRSCERVAAQHGHDGASAVVQPDVWYSYGPSAEFPELETGGIGPMAGPALDLDAVRKRQGLASTRASRGRPTTTASRCSTSGRVTT